MGSATMLAAEPDLAPGTVVGDYRIDHTIGIGGMAAVYQATQPVIGKRVAIKVLHRTKSETALSRFIKEARAVNLIGHPNIVDVFGFGMTDSGRAYLVMELLVGETLAVRIRRGPISVAEACEILVEVTHALEAAHEAGVIHRDLKPENIFLAKRKDVSSVKLLDFGIAKLTDVAELGRDDDTRPGVLIGTPRYISPEQVRGNVLDGRADIYALGVVAFELLAGRLPFTGAAGAYELFEKHAVLKPPKPSAFNVKLPEAADELVGAMLAKMPAERPALSAVRDALLQLRLAPASDLAAERAAASAQPTDVHAAPARPGSIAESTTTLTERVSFVVEEPTIRRTPAEPPPRRRWVLRLGIGIAVVVAAVIATAIATTGTPLPPRVDAPVSRVPMVAQPPPRVTPIAPPARQAPPKASPAVAVDPDTNAIEFDPVSQAPARTAHVHHPKQPTAAPAAVPPPAASNQDAVRSPFEQAP